MPRPFDFDGESDAHWDCGPHTIGGPHTYGGSHTHGGPHTHVGERPYRCRVINLEQTYRLFVVFRLCHSRCSVAKNNSSPLFVSVANYKIVNVF